MQNYIKTLVPGDVINANVICLSDILSYLSLSSLFSYIVSTISSYISGTDISSLTKFTSSLLLES